MNLGFQVSFPFGNNSRYDFIVDAYGKLYRIQCKSSNKKQSGAFYIRTFSCHFKSGCGKAKTQTYTREQIDFFCTIIESDCYVIPVEFGENKTQIAMMIGNGSKRFYSIDAEACRIDRVFTPECLNKPSLTEKPRKEKIQRLKVAIIATDVDLRQEFLTKSIYWMSRKYGCSRRCIVLELKKRGIYHELKDQHNLLTIHRQAQEHSKVVIQCDKSGKVINEYASAKEAEKFGFKRNVVQMCCTGYKKSYKGFLWHYK